jgi:shikimate dehydrogenase
VRFAIVGDPVDHSRSPAIHNAAFAALGIDASYEFLRTPPGHFGDVVTTLRSGALTGVNVTMPHKQTAYESVDSRSNLAELSGAVNTIVMHGTTMFGTNTDVAGVTHALAITETGPETPLLVLGAGGAAAAAIVAGGRRPVFVSCRNTQSGEALLARTGSTGSVLPWGEGVAGAIVVNATPLGMHGEPLPDAPIDACAAFIDMTYGLTDAPSLVMARERDLPVADGIDMLIGQAIEAFTVFTGLDAPVAVIEAAARNAR